MRRCIRSHSQSIGTNGGERVQIERYKLQPQTKVINRGISDELLARQCHVLVLEGQCPAELSSNFTRIPVCKILVILNTSDYFGSGVFIWG